MPVDLRDANPFWALYLPPERRRKRDLYWTGEGWSSSERRAAVYSYEEAVRVNDLELGGKCELGELEF